MLPAVKYRPVVFLIIFASSSVFRNTALGKEFFGSKSQYLELVSFEVTVPQYKLEEEYLRTMHNQGWKLSHIGFPCFYHFTECTPEDVIYQLDYNLDASRNKEEYIQMFTDLGWEYLFNFAGYSYFKKPVQQMTGGTEEIFCDDESRLEMMKHVLKGRLYPLLIFFFTLILPQLLLQTFLAETGELQKVLAILYLIFFFIYILFFVTFGVHFFSYEKKIRKPDKAFRSKYIALSILTVVLCVFALFCGTRLWAHKDSEYTVNAQSNQYSGGVEFLNDTLTHELSLLEGDDLALSFVVTDGEFSVNICLEGETPIFEGSINKLFSCTLAIPQTGNYQIVITGKKAEGSFNFQIQ